MAPVPIDGILLYRVPPAILSSFANATPPEMAQHDAVASFALLVDGTRRYLSAGLLVVNLTPWRVHQLHMLDLPEGARGAGPDNNWWHRHWLGPAGNSSVGIGILGRYEDLQLVVERYRPYAREILFPYPKRLDDPRPQESGQLFMIFDREGLSRAATASPSDHPQAM